MSISDSLTALQTAKSDIATAITAKGGTVNAGDGFSDFATDIGTITGGGGNLGLYPINSECRPTGDVVLPSIVTSIPMGYSSGGTTYGVFSGSPVASVSGANVTRVGEKAFMYCSNLTSYSFPLINYIGAQAFSYSGLSCAINIPLSVTTLGGSAFSYSRITSVTWGDSVEASDKLVIGNSLFTMCQSLTTATYPARATTVSNGCFSNCTALETLTVNFVPTSQQTYLTQISSLNWIYRCTALETLTLSNDWIANMMISDGTTNYTNVLSHDSIVDIFSKLHDYTGDTSSHWIRIGATNLARVSAEEIAVATAKNWTVS
jgi:hypothetical protein